MKIPKQQPVQIQTYQHSSIPSLGDRILIFTRSHVFYLGEKIIITTLIILALIVIAGGIFFYIYFAPLLFFFSLPLLVTFGLTMCINEYLDWYFHFYLVTTRKIVEVSNTPFGNYFINEILLDKVKVTEVDITSKGLVNQLLRIGDVNVTFDRPTQHRESFIFSNISNANTIRELLTDYFSDEHKAAGVWYSENRRKGLIYPLEETNIPKLHA